MQTVSYVADVARETVGVGTAGNGTAPIAVNWDFFGKKKVSNNWILIADKLYTAYREDLCDSTS